MIVIAAIATAIASPSNATEFWFKPDGSGLTPGAQKIIDRGVPAVGSVPFREFKEPTYQSRTTITSAYGTSVYTFRSYSR
jgi:hypothetical protein